VKDNSTSMTAYVVMMPYHHPESESFLRKDDR